MKKFGLISEEDVERETATGDVWRKENIITGLELGDYVEGIIASPGMYKGFIGYGYVVSDFHKGDPTIKIALRGIKASTEAERTIPLGHVDAEIDTASCSEDFSWIGKMLREAAVKNAAD